MTRLAPMRRAAAIAAAIALVLPACAGCSTVDPYLRDGTWRPTGANDGNLAAMVAEPRHLVAGREGVTSNGVLAAAAIDRLQRDKLKPLIGTDFKVGGGAGVAATGDGAGATGAN